jgi:nicotinamide riboside transporter PnuC
MPKLLGREPAIWLSLIATTIRLLAAFLVDLTADQQAILNAVAAAAVGLAIAFVVRDGQVAAVLGLVQAVLSLAVGFGLDISAENQAVIMSFVGTVAAAFVRTQVIAPVAESGARQA